MWKRLVRVTIVLAVVAVAAALSTVLAVLLGLSPRIPPNPEAALVLAAGGALASIELGIGRRGFARPNAVSAIDE
ncbi:MAG: hypothetical protein ACFCVK_11370 [Acidimicrobiales bacterium]